jgi:vacuolar iron transporter family protein
VIFILIGPVDMSRLHVENHNAHRVGWLRAAVLGANDGLVSTASLILGVAAAHAATGSILIAGTAGLVAGAMSMAAGEYVSVSSQSDTESADLARERKELVEQPKFELQELAQSFVARGATAATALQISKELTAADAIGAHAREELGITDITTARPLQAALTSALTFAIGAALPLAMVVLAPSQSLIMLVTIATLIFLAVLGALGAYAGGANVLRGTARVTFWGAVAMAITAGVGAYFGAVV